MSMDFFVNLRRRLLPVQKADHSQLIVSLLTAACLCVLAVYVFWVPLVYRWEDFMYILNPTPERAFEYGERHFSATDPKEYDIARSHIFFSLAARQDTKLQYVHHELARVFFLEGNYQRALAEINTQIEQEGDKTPNSYYIRGLIEGFMGDYSSSIRDYAHFLQLDPNDWAAVNDYAWVLLKDNHPENAVNITDAALRSFPNNPWILNTNATAYYEIGDIQEAKKKIEAASAALEGVTETVWLHAYPGNDPKIARLGIQSFRHSVEANMHTIESASTSTAQK